MVNQLPLKIKSSNVICLTLPQEHGFVYKPQSNQATEMFGTSNNCSKLDLGLTSITRLGFLHKFLRLMTVPYICLFNTLANPGSFRYC